jgi:hypothetical protein
MSFSISVVARCRPQAVAREKVVPGSRSDLFGRYGVGHYLGRSKGGPTGSGRSPRSQQRRHGEGRLNTTDANIPPIPLSFPNTNKKAMPRTATATKTKTNAPPERTARHDVDDRRRSGRDGPLADHRGAGNRLWQHGPGRAAACFGVPARRDVRGEPATSGAPATVALTLLCRHRGAKHAISRVL